MTNFKNGVWNNQKDKVLFYGRLNKLLQHPEIKESLARTNNAWIMRRVKTPGKIPLDKLTQFLGSAVYYDKTTNKWYGQGMSQQDSTK